MRDSSEILDQASQIAARAHQGQRDKVGQPYILHPLRMMLKMESNAEKIVAVLHDVVEDTSVTLEDLRRAGFPQDVLDAVDCLTKREGESYEQFIQRAKSNSLARHVKIADLGDNMDPKRLPSVGEADRKRLEKYRGALAELTSR